MAMLMHAVVWKSTKIIGTAIAVSLCDYLLCTCVYSEWLYL